MKTKLILTQEPNAYNYALDVLQNYGTVAFPTDTVYGLAALAFDTQAVERLYTVKKREQTQAIAILLSADDKLPLVAENPNRSAKRLAAAFWPGPLTLVLPRHPDVPHNLSNRSTIGVRIPDHPVALELLRNTGPLAVTSANLSGQENTCTAQEVLAQLEGRVHLILDGGRTPGGVPSTVVDATKEEIEILREGPIKQKDLLKVLI
jgi:L-threonylcarbamoyladenylate synthase